MNHRVVLVVLCCAVSLLFGQIAPLSAAERLAPGPNLECKVSTSPPRTGIVGAGIGGPKQGMIMEARFVVRNASLATIPAGTRIDYKLQLKHTGFNQYGVPTGSYSESKPGLYQLRKDLHPGREQVFLTETYKKLGVAWGLYPTGCEASIHQELRSK